MTAPSGHAPGLLHEFFAHAAALHPARIAIDVPPAADRPHRTTVTYEDLARTSDAIAAMIAQHAAPRDVIAIILPRTEADLYAAQLGALKAGCAFTCIDPAFPDLHISRVIHDAAPAVVLSDQAGLNRLASANLDGDDSRSLRMLNVRSAVPGSTAPAVSVGPEDLAYIVYTSGTTGQPKGVMIEHRGIVNLVASDLIEFGCVPGDRVAQGSSAAYDSSIEETWLALAAGATLVVMDDAASRMGPDLVPWLQSERISVFCPPPTLLRTTGCTNPHEVLPDLRLLYVGGEALTDDLVDRWARGRRLVNGYGPTECTVTVVRGDVTPGSPVTIGKAVPGNQAMVLDAQLRPVPRTQAGSEAGELCISGVGLARGYRNQPALTQQKFPHIEPFGRIYRTGDLVREDADGNLVYLGRIDAQVKLRGYRIELEAIEASMAACEGVREAACRVQGEGSQAILVAYMVPRDPAAVPSESSMKQVLSATLPVYMVPARIGVIDVLPRSVGGKLDRKRLPDLDAPDSRAASARRFTPPATGLEATMVAAFASALGRKSPISTDEDFFRDLGGDSISVVGVICELRRHVGMPPVTTRDLYETRTAAALASRLTQQVKRETLRASIRREDATERTWPALVTVIQVLWILLGVGVAGALAYAAAFLLVPAMLERFGVLGTLVLEVPLAMLALMAYTVSTVFLTLALKLALIGRYESMYTPVWSMRYLRHWIVQSAARLIPWGFLAGTPVCGMVLRCLGARVGQRVHIHRGVNLQDGGWDLLSIGDDVTLGRDVHLGLVGLESGCLVVGSVTLERESTLETRAIIGAGARLARQSVLAALSWLPDGTQVPAQQCWSGVPARCIGPAPAAPSTAGAPALPVGIYGALHLMIEAIGRAGTAIPLLVLVGTLAVWWNVPAAAVLDWMAEPSVSAWGIFCTICGTIAWVPLTLVLKAFLVRALGTVKPGVIPRWSLSYLRIWQKAELVESAGLWLTGTLYWPIWLRLAGMKIGPDCEISTITDVIPETISIGGGSFFADGIYLGGPVIHRGTVTVAHTSLGRGTFLGNHVIIPAGARLPDDFFLGVCTVAPTSGASPGSSWFGHPALELPGREVVAIDRSLTHSPGFARYCSRLFWETLRWALPIVPFAAASFWYWAVNSWDVSLLAHLLLVAPIAGAAIIGAECALVVVLKWLLLGRAAAGQHALWSCWCSRWDFLYVAWQFYALRALSVLEGTLLLACYLRAMGVRIGRRVVLGPGMSQVADPDMIVIEDDATVCANYQAHSFEDRVLKLAPTVVRRGATVGEAAVVFYGAQIGEEAWVTPGSVVMKNEQVAAREIACGCPVQTYEPAATTAEADRGRDRSQAPLDARRSLALDVARGVAVIGMIYMHLVPTTESGVAGGTLPGLLATLLEGKAAALFFVLAGIAWELQARRSPAPSGLYLLRRSLSLAAVGIALHLLVWPTQVLVSLAVMMVLMRGLRGMHRTHLMAVGVALLAAAALLPVFAGATIDADWTADGGHLADSTLGWATVRALCIDGNYPIIPWLVFPIIGTFMAASWGDEQTRRGWLGASLLAIVLGLGLVVISRVDPDWSEALAPYLACEWVPTTIPFVLITGGCAVAVITASAGWWRERRACWIVREVALLGRSSLTHYLLHILVVYLPLKLVIGNDEWSAVVGVAGFAGYVAAAMVMSHVWFGKFRRGPVEGVWAVVSGSSTNAKT